MYKAIRKADMRDNIAVKGIRNLRILQKEMLHRKEAKDWLQEFPDIKLSSAYKKEIDRYWGGYGVKVSGLWHRFFLGCTGMEDVRFLDNGLYYSKIICRLNRLELSMAYDDKNVYDILFGDRLKRPETLVRNMNGIISDGNYQNITIGRAKRILLNVPKCIVKPTMGTNGGRGIVVLKNMGDETYEKAIEEVLLNKKDIIIQRFISQHHEYGIFNESSVNTVRVFSFLWKNEVHILTTYFRIGNKEKDFVECHTYIVKIENDGKLGRGVNDHDFMRKPTENHEYGELINDMSLPGIEEMIEIVKKEHKRLSYFGLIGWDFAVDETGEPVLIEINTHWPALDHVQMLNGPAFGDMTDDVMKYVFSDKKLLKQSIYIGI